MCVAKFCPTIFCSYCSFYFEKLETLVPAAVNVNHMEIDLYKTDGTILYSDSTQLKTTDGVAISVVASGFKYVSGFKQLNSSHVIVVDSDNDCIKIVNRIDQSRAVLAGTCGASGFIDGTSARFFNPYQVELDERNVGYLLVTDRLNNALRTIEIASGMVGTVIRTGFNNPAGLAWYHGRLLVSNNYYLSQVLWSFNGTITNTKLTTHTLPGHQDGNFSAVQFSQPFGIHEIVDGLFLVADSGNKKLRLLSMKQKKVLPVCIGSDSNCTTSTQLSSSPRSFLVSNETVYVGGYRSLFKLTGNFIWQILSLP